MNDVHAQCAKSVSTAMMLRREIIIFKAISKVDTSFDATVLENLAVSWVTRGRLDIYPDKSEIFLWDGVPIIKFYPIKFEMIGMKMQVSQEYVELYK